MTELQGSKVDFSVTFTVSARHAAFGFKTGQIPAIALHVFGIQICMGRKLPSTAEDLNTSIGIKHLGLCHGDLSMDSQAAQPNCNGLKARGRWGDGNRLHRGSGK